jgi:hypothetical protein
MGIFARRAIRKHEELTFNYNVDRYGCVPVEDSGGRALMARADTTRSRATAASRTASASSAGRRRRTWAGWTRSSSTVRASPLFPPPADARAALGITDEVETLGLKGSKKKKGRKLDEDYTPVLAPLGEAEVPKLVLALKQTSSRKVLAKLLARIRMTQDPAALRNLMRLRGFSVFSNVLADYAADAEICTTVRAPWLACDAGRADPGGRRRWRRCGTGRSSTGTRSTTQRSPSPSPRSRSPRTRRSRRSRRGSVAAPPTSADRR